MIDKTRPHDPAKNKKGTLPAFTPVPRQCNRHDGWTPERQQRFIEALADLGSVRAAAHVVNMAPEGAYQLRRHPEAREFRKAWEAALALGVQRLEDVAMERALDGVEVPVYHFGAVVGTRRHYNDRLLMFLLRNRAPKRFAADSWQKTDAVTQGQLRKLRAQWREEWEREAAEAEAGIYDSIDADLDRMQRNWHASLSPRVRRLYDAFRAAEAEDSARPALPAPPDPAPAPADGEEDAGRPSGGPLIRGL